MIWIVGGTTEAVTLGKLLDGQSYVITYGTEEGVERGIGNSIYNRMDELQMERFIVDYNIDLVLDVSHPYAQNVTRNVHTAAKNMGVTYLRYERTTTPIPQNAIVVETVDECCNFFKKKQGTVFISTGSNNVVDFESVRRKNRFIYRILPTTESITKVRNAGVGIEDIVAMMGPFSEEINISMLRFFDAEYMVLKDSGEAGGTYEKLSACEKTNVTPIVIGRTGGNYLSDWEEFIGKVRENIRI